MGRNGRFSRCWESFVPVELMYAVCWESFVPVVAVYAVCGESFVPVAAMHTVCGESFVPGSVRCVAGEWWFAGKSSPCSGSLRPDRDNFLPARVKRAEMGVFRDAGRVLYRLSSCTPCAGRVLYRLWPCTPCAGRVLYRLRPCIPCAGRVLYRGVCAAWLVSGGLREKVLPARVVCVPTVTIFSLLASKGPKWAFFAMRGEFCTG